MATPLRTDGDVDRSLLHCEGAANIVRGLAAPPDERVSSYDGIDDLLPVMTAAGVERVVPLSNVAVATIDPADVAAVAARAPAPSPIGSPRTRSVPVTITPVSQRHRQCPRPFHISLKGERQCCSRTRTL
jgi:hypothetical protein